MTTAIEALLAYQQADDDGVMVLASRQAIHEVADQVSSLQRAIAAIRAALDGGDAPELAGIADQRSVQQAAKEPTPEMYVLPLHEETMAALGSLTIRKER